MDNLAVELIAQICDNIPLIDQLALCRANKKFNSLSEDFVKRCFSDTLAKKLGSANSARSFCAMLSEHCVLSGSIVLQTLLDEEYESSDIDLYVEPCQITAVCATLERLGYLSPRPPSYYPGTKFNVLKYSKAGHSGIDVILCTFLNDSIKAFDFDFLRNKFDGNAVSYSSSVRSRSCEIHVKRPFCALRVEKYTQRGFKFFVDSRELFESCARLHIPTSDLDWFSRPGFLLYSEYRDLYDREGLQRQRLQERFFNPMKKLSRFFRDHPATGLRQRFAELCREVDEVYEKDFFSTYIDLDVSRALTPPELLFGRGLLDWER